MPPIKKASQRDSTEKELALLSAFRAHTSQLEEAFGIGLDAARAVKLACSCCRLTNDVLQLRKMIRELTKEAGNG